MHVQCVIVLAFKLLLLEEKTALPEGESHILMRALFSLERTTRASRHGEYDSDNNTESQ